MSVQKFKLLRNKITNHIYTRYLDVFDIFPKYQGQRYNFPLKKLITCKYPLAFLNWPDVQCTLIMANLVRKTNRQLTPRPKVGLLTFVEISFTHSLIHERESKGKPKKWDWTTLKNWLNLPTQTVIIVIYF